MTLVVAAFLIGSIGHSVESSASTVSAIDITIKARALQPGELLVVSLVTDPAAEDLLVRAFGQVVPAHKLDNGRWQALLGIDIDQHPGTYSVVAAAGVRGGLVSGRYELKVIPKRFATRRLMVAAEFVDPPASMAERIASETAFLSDVYAHSTPERLWTGPFVRPVPDPANSRFGTRSIFNGKPRNAHAGTDFLSAAGTEIKAPNSGRIVVARDLYFSGNTVVIDHGQGLFSLLAHLSRIDVTEGDRVDAGMVVGLVGKTGRVTGPHLHWALRAAGARTDPLAALELLGSPQRRRKR